jgi:hypothetical protein
MAVTSMARESQRALDKFVEHVEIQELVHMPVAVGIIEKEKELPRGRPTLKLMFMLWMWKKSGLRSVRMTKEY